MITDLFRLSKSAASIPASALFGLIRRGRTAGHGIVDVTVERIEDVLQREVWMQQLRRLLEDDGIEGVVFDFREPPGGYAACQDLRELIQDLARGGKATYGFLEHGTNATVWLASACERVFAVPTGDLALVGVGVEMTFFGQALESLGLTPDFEAAGAYKSFGEPFSRSFASPANLEATTQLVADLHQQLVADIASDRGIEPDVMEGLLHRAPLANVEGVVEGLLDQILYSDQLDSWLTEHHGERAKRIAFDDWSRLDRIANWIERWGGPSDHVAVVHLQGNIVMEDKSGGLAIRARTVVPLLEKLRKDEHVSAVVLHVNSPGGQVLASDLIWREVEQLRTTKPVVACFEDVSASGGFWLSAPATEIIARPATLTGSIGVFGGKLVAGEGMRKLGVTTQAVLAAPNAALFSPSAPFTDDQRSRFKQNLQRIYDGFVHRVAVGRRQSEEAIEPYCRGRVWTGRQAMAHGLVDRLGGLQDAVARARVLAGLDVDSPRVDHSGQPELNMFQRLARDVRKEVLPPSPIGALLGGATSFGQLRFVAANANQPLALMPFELPVR